MMRGVLIWDRVVRTLHWCLVVAVASAWLTGGSAGTTHDRLGYFALGVVFARSAWGLWGSRHARFVHFVRSPRVTAGYVKGVLKGQAPRYLGHNPLGAWMVLALLACVGSLGITGWLYTTDWLWGYAWLAQLHASLAYVLLALVSLHLAGVLWTSWQHRENLVRAMLTGRKREPESGDE